MIQIRKKKNKIYSWKDDCLKRKKIALWMIEVIKNIKQPFIINLNIRYGDGKTFFLKSTLEYLKEQGINSEYISFSMSNISNRGVINLLFKKLKNNFYSKKNKVIFNKIEKAIGLIKIIENKLFQSDDILDSFREEIIDENFNVISFLDKDASNILSLFVKLDNSRDELQEFIKEEFKTVLDSKAEESNLKFIFLIDDIDFCTSRYIMSFFEIIKTFFAIPGVVFLIASDEREIERRLFNHYGINTNTKGMLDKFIDWKVEIPIKRNSINFIERLNKELKTNLSFVNTNAISRILKNFDFTLREIEKALIEYYSIINNCIEYEEEFKDEDIWVLFFIYALKIKRKDLYKKIKQDNYNFKEIKEITDLYLPKKKDELFKNIITGIFCVGFSDEIKHHIQKYALNKNSEEFIYWRKILTLINNLKKEDRLISLKENNIDERVLIEEIIKYIEYSKQI